METRRKGKRVSKKNKKAWRKHTDTSDVDNYLDDKRLEERLGGAYDKKSSCDLFIFDNVQPSGKAQQSYNEKIASKKKSSLEPPRCFHILQSWSAVPDPIVKRNQVGTPKKHKHSETQRKESGILRRREIDAPKYRLLSTQRRVVPKRGDYKRDIWEGGSENFLGRAAEWMSDDAIRHNLTGLGKFKVRAPKTFMKASKCEKTSTLPATEVPHPGTSYNPSLIDHQDLLQKIIEKEEKVSKEEKHIARVTTDLFSRVTADDKHTTWLSEMSEGLHHEVQYDENGGEYKGINPPTRRDKKKTLQKRRRLREAKLAAFERKKFRIEKKKVSDIYKLRFLSQELDSKEAKQVLIRKKREKKRAALVNKTKQLSSHKFVEPDLEFNSCHEIRGSLRALKPEGNLLADRFYSMQKRNIIEPTVKINKLKKKKIKRIVKASHKMPETT